MPVETARSTVNTAFEELLPELQSRCRRMARSFRGSRKDLADDALAAAFLNYASAHRRGKRLDACDLGWASALHLRHRSHAGKRRCQTRSEQRTVSLHVAAQSLSGRLVEALSTDERTDPAVRVQVRCDWRAFARTQNRRVRRILLWLVRGEHKQDIACRLGISQGRVSRSSPGCRATSWRTSNEAILQHS